MKKWLLILGGGLLGLVLIGLGLGAYMLSRFDAKPQLEAALTQATGRQATIGGSVHPSYFPTLGFHAKDVRLANAAGGQASDMIAIKEVQIGIGARGLFNRQVEVNRLRLVEPQIALEIGADAKPNWEFKPTAPAQPGAAPAVRDVKLDNVTIENGLLTYIDLRNPGAQPLRIEALNLSAALASLDSPLALNGDARYRDQPVKLTFTLKQPRALMEGKPGPAPFDVSLDGPALKMKFDGQLDPKDGALTGALDASGPSVRGLSTWLGAPMADGAGLDVFAVNGTLAMRGPAVEIQNATVALDALKGRGDRRVDTGRKRPYLSGRIELPSLDFNAYLINKNAPTAEVATVDARKESGWGTLPIDMGGLRAFDMDMELIITGPLTVQKLKADRARMSLVVNDGFLAATLYELAMYGGTGVGRLELDGRNNGLTFRQELDLTNVLVADFLKDAANVTNLEGAGALKVRLEGRGINQQGLMRSLTGAAQLDVGNGALRGVNLGGVARTIRQALSGEMVGPQARTAFDTFNVGFTIADGVAATRDLRIRAKDAEITAAGTIDIGMQALDMRITPKAESLFGRIIPGAGVAIPFRAQGPWRKIGYSSDMLGAARGAIDARVNEILTRARPVGPVDLRPAGLPPPVAAPTP
jgi:AsmA protein